MSWWLMGGYAPYVWSAYALVLGALGVAWWRACARLTRYLKRK